MTTISERLRRLSETGANIVSDPLDLAAREAADTVDALVAALEEAVEHIRGVTGSDHRPDSDSAEIVSAAQAALALARKGGK